MSDEPGRYRRNIRVGMPIASAIASDDKCQLINECNPKLFYAGCVPFELTAVAELGGKIPWPNSELSVPAQSPAPDCWVEWGGEVAAGRVTLAMRVSQRPKQPDRFWFFWQINDEPIVLSLGRLNNSFLEYRVSHESHIKIILDMITLWEVFKALRAKRAIKSIETIVPRSARRQFSRNSDSALPFVIYRDYVIRLTSAQQTRLCDPNGHPCPGVAFHLVLQSEADYRVGPGLFGKLHCKVNRPAHWRGSQRLGAIAKRYVAPSMDTGQSQPVLT